MDVLAALKSDWPAPAPTSDDVDFNDATYSIECNGTNDGRPFTPEMVDNLVRFCAAICREHGWKQWSVIGHRELTLRKPSDPSGIDMHRLREMVLERLMPGGAQDVDPPASVKPVDKPVGYTPKRFDRIAARSRRIEADVAAIRKLLEDKQ